MHDARPFRRTPAPHARAGCLNGLARRSALPREQFGHLTRVVLRDRRLRRERQATGLQPDRIDATLAAERTAAPRIAPRMKQAIPATPRRVAASRRGSNVLVV
ncbi:hypothetical protein [Burkholderia diffusa]|uniref:hypothetical protein n=1 Tax=Burkholderia diffusa TaxID=488732 RepID=UPI00157A617C|nr:hypothetical protein [Burkholderia diffusa]NTY38294.1 hypothetical protein [Burkholderia diffusa]